MYIMSEDDTQIVMTINKRVEDKLLSTGYDTLNQDEKNDLITVLARKDNKLFSEITPDYILSYHKSRKIAELNQTCDDTICAGFTASNGHHYRTNRDDQTNMIGQKDELNDDSTITTVPWKTEDAGYINHTREEWLQIYSEAFAFKKQQLFHYDSLKKTVTECQDHPSIIAVSWS